MSGMVMYPVAKMMAVGGAAVGSMKENEHAVVTAIIRYSGLRPMDNDWNKWIQVSNIGHHLHQIQGVEADRQRLQCCTDFVRRNYSMLYL